MHLSYSEAWLRLMKLPWGAALAQWFENSPVALRRFFRLCLFAVLQEEFFLL